MASVQFGETFLLVGGELSSSTYNGIFEFDPESEEWIIREETLPTGVPESGMAVLVGDDIVNCA